ncbi:MAG: transglycosylase domain-containing protein [Candidatus Saccharimonas sp.]
MAKRKKSSRRVSLYSNLAIKHRTRKDSKARKRAEYLATLPKNPVARFFYRLHPKRVAGFWFSRRGLFFALKSIGIMVALLVLVGLSLFAYYRKDLDAIRPSTLAARVKSTVTTYYDRNGKVLWEDKGSGNYTLVVDASTIAPCMGKATIAIEDKDFYNHGGVSISGTLRALINNTQGNSTQGGSTLTQQLVKQVFFDQDQASQRGLAGIPRKIKEAILSIEVERMYSKDQILGLYLNESPYGGRRNGVESAAQTYFGKSSKDLDLPECALLASIPNQPGLYDPYNIDGHAALLDRQHKVLDNMVSEGYITKQQATDAKNVPILDEIKPLADQLTNIRAPHFVLMVRAQLEASLGKTIVGEGGLSVTTTLDLDVQDQLEKSMTDIFDGAMTDNNCGYRNCANYAGFSNGAAAIENTKTGQILGLVGSRDFSYPGYGQDNAATAFIQPGSTIKPLIYAQLLQDQGPGNANYGSGSVLSDTSTNFNGYIPRDADGKFQGNITIRQALGRSRNIPAIKAMAISERNKPGSTLALTHAAGDFSYCTDGADAQAGLSMAIGGCGVKLVDHINAMATIGRMGAYVPQSSVLKVTNSSGQVLQEYKASSKQVMDPQAAYIVADMAGDQRARAGLAGADYMHSLDKLGVHVAAKTGTSNGVRNGVVVPKDLWTIGFTPTLSMAVWLGNPDTTPLLQGNSLIPAMFLDRTMASVSQLYADQGQLGLKDWYTEPAGIQHIGGELYPSYYNKSTGVVKDTMTFDKVSKKLATDATPPGARIDIEITKVKDPFTGKEVISAPDGYDPNSSDDVHAANDKGPTVKISITGHTATVSYTAQTFTLQSIVVKAGGSTPLNKTVSGSIGSDTIDLSSVPAGTTVTATVTDTGLYTESDTATAN